MTDRSIHLDDENATFVVGSENGIEGAGVMLKVQPLTGRLSSWRAVTFDDRTFVIGPRQARSFASALAPELTDDCPDAEWAGEDQAWRVTDCAPGIVTQEAPDYDDVRAEREPSVSSLVAERFGVGRHG